MFAFAWRNIWRQPRRTVLTVLAVMFTTAVLSFFISIQFSSYETSINASTAIFYGHMQIQAEGYLAKPQIRRVIRQAPAIKRAVSASAEVKHAAIRAAAFALASSKLRSYGVQIIGVEPLAERQVSTMPDSIKQGKFLSADHAQEVVIGRKLASNLQVGLGDEITILGQGLDGSLAATVLPVAGIFDSASSEMNRSLIEIPLGTFQETFYMNDSAHQIVLQTADVRRLDNLQDQLNSLLAAKDNGRYRLEALRWDELLPGLKQSIEMDMASASLFYISLVLIVGFTILNTFLMSVMERTREFGVMLALGARPGRISRLIMLESFLLTSIGIALGLVVGCLVTYYFYLKGFSIPGTEEIMKMWNLPATIYPKIRIESLLIGPCVILFSAAGAIIYPIFKIWKLEAVEALKAV